MEIPKDLREAIDAAVAGTPVRDLAAVVERLVERYRAGGAVTAPILVSSADVAAYAAYRMPATFAAVRAALAAAGPASALSPRTLLDLGGGTGAALWAAAASFRSLTEATVLDQVPAALALGARIAAGADAKVVRTAQWQQGFIAAELPPADLVTAAYLLAELSEPDQADLVRRAAGAAAELLLLVEPGTPDGYRRILAARTRLIEDGHTVLAPCPHQDACPLAAGRDWCHFATRVSRSALHRRLKSAELSYEDEKFAYLAVAPAGASAASAPVAAGRVIRHPLQRKGLVSLQVCTAGRGVVTELVPRSQGERYRAARDVAWGDAWAAD